MSVLRFLVRMDLKNCSFAVPRLPNFRGADSKYSIATLKGKTFFEFPKHFLRQLYILMLRFYMLRSTFQMPAYILLNIHIISLNNK